MTFHEAVSQHLLAHKMISYGEAMEIATEFKRKFVTINRYLQNDKQQGREWGFVKLNVAGKVCKRNAPWVFKKFLPKAYQRFKKQMRTTKFKK